MASPKILICDDEEGIRESLKLVLGDHYNLIAVDTADMAIKTLSQSKDIQVVLLDIKMPKTSGTFDRSPRVDGGIDGALGIAAVRGATFIGLVSAVAAEQRDTNSQVE